MRQDTLQIWINGEKIAEDGEGERKIYQGNTILGNFGRVATTPRYFKGFIYSLKAYDGPITQEKMKNNSIENMQRYTKDTLETEQYNDYVNMNHILIPSEDDFTLEIVTEMKKYPSELCFIMGQSDSKASVSNRFGLRYSKGDELLAIHGGTTGFAINYKPKLNEKITITLRRTSSSLEVFINGISVGNYDMTGIKPYQANTILGRWGLYDNRYANIIIYSVRKYDTAITDEQINQNYNVDKLRFEM